MASVCTLVRMKRGGRYHPPGSIFRDLSESEVCRLAGYVEAIDAEDAPAAMTALPSDDAPSPTSEGASDGPEGSEGGEDRVSEVLHAIDLLEPSDFASDGAPAAKALADVLGFEPSADEIATALALKAEFGR